MLMQANNSENTYMETIQISSEKQINIRDYFLKYKYMYVSD